MRPEILKTLFFGGVLPLVASLILNTTAPEWIWVHAASHAALEAFGSLAGFAIACFIVILLLNREIQRRYIWIAAGLAAMGTLDCVHALQQPGQAFVWSHSLANIVGGVLFAGVWLPPLYAPPRRRAMLSLALSVALALTLGIAVSLVGDDLPALVRDGTYTQLAANLNLIGAIGFIGAAVYIMFRSKNISGNEKTVFSAHAFLFGVASLLFQISSPWDASWWLWHALRATAYVVALSYFFRLFQRQVQTLKTNEYRLRHLLRTVFDTTKEGVIFVGIDGSIANLNPAAQQMFKRDEATPTNLWPGDLLQEVIQDTGLTSELTAPALKGVRSDGSVFEAETSQTRLRPGGPFAEFITVRDVSSRKEAERRVYHLVTELQAKTRELEQSNAELDTFAYIASHDLRSPLRTIQNAVVWLEEDLTAHLTDDTRATMDIILRRTRRMEDLLQDLLLHSRIQRSDVTESIISGAELMAVIQDLSAQKDGFSIQSDAAFDRIKVQKLPLLHVLLSLIDNAIKHHDSTSGTVFLSASETEEAYVLVVSDDGPGIPRKYHSKIFEMFTTLHPRDKVEGSGMGLAIAKKYATVSGGSIAIFSEGRGCRFIVTWPKAHESEIPAERSA